MDGFEGTNGIVKSLVSAGIGEVVSLVEQLLAQVVPVDDEFDASKGQIPSWVKPRERKLLQSSGVSPDAVVALDGSGNYGTIMDAVLAAPDYSMKRFVIYIKKGVYVENVEIKKKKWNIMMVGDGMDATVISGNRSYIDGWTTFRSSTFGKFPIAHHSHSHATHLFFFHSYFSFSLSLIFTVHTLNKSLLIKILNFLPFFISIYVN